MKKKFLITAISMLFFPILIAGCNGEGDATVAGPKGEQGIQGIPGPKGEDGNNISTIILTNAMHNVPENLLQDKKWIVKRTEKIENEEGLVWKEKNWIMGYKEYENLSQKVLLASVEAMGFDKNKFKPLKIEINNDDRTFKLITEHEDYKNKFDTIWYDLKTLDKDNKIPTEVTITQDNADEPKDSKTINLKITIETIKLYILPKKDNNKSIIITNSNVLMHLDLNLEIQLTK